MLKKNIIEYLKKKNKIKSCYKNKVTKTRKRKILIGLNTRKKHPSIQEPYSICTSHPSMTAYKIPMDCLYKYTM